MRDHLILLGWFVVTATINYLMRTRTAEQWEALAQKNPRYAALARMLRAVGVDPVKLIESAVDIVRGEAQTRTGLCSQASCTDSAVKRVEDPAQASEQAKEEEKQQ